MSRTRSPLAVVVLLTAVAPLARAADSRVVTGTVTVRTDAHGRIGLLVDSSDPGATPDGMLDTVYLFSAEAPADRVLEHAAHGATLIDLGDRVTVTTPDGSFYLDLALYDDRTDPPRAGISIRRSDGVELIRLDEGNLVPVGSFVLDELPGLRNPEASRCGTWTHAADCDAGGRGSGSCGVTGCSVAPNGCNAACAGTNYACCGCEGGKAKCQCCRSVWW